MRAMYGLIVSEPLPFPNNVIYLLLLLYVENHNTSLAIFGSPLSGMHYRSVFLFCPSSAEKYDISCYDYR